MKPCTKCGIEKLLTEFSKDKRQKNGRRPDCKLCGQQRPSYLLKSIRFRLKHPSTQKWYKGIENELTKEDIASMERVCYFCKKPILRGASLHRLDHTGNYTIDNTVMVDKVCHARFGGHTRAKNPNKGFGSFSKEYAQEMGKRGRLSQYNNRT